MAAWAASHLMSSSEVESALALAETKRDMVVVVVGVVVYAQVGSSLSSGSGKLELYNLELFQNVTAMITIPVKVLPVIA